MTPNLLQMVVAAVLVALAFFLVWRFVTYKRTGSDRRLNAMFDWVGVTPALAHSASSQPVIKGIRARCRRCQVEGRCERWLAGELSGDNEFCPNAAALNALATGAGTLRHH